MRSLGKLAFSTLAIALTLAVAGCGVRGNLEKPKAVVDAPAQTADGDVPAAAPRRSGSFVLDGLVQ